MSKFRPPVARATLVSREHLLSRLREGRERSLTLVCAPAGYGKTTVLAQWAAADRERTPFVWFFADEADADPIRLWSHLIHALRLSHPDVGRESLAALNAGTGALTSRIIPLLLQELETAPSLVIVLEDWHRVGNALCDETLSFFVERAPTSAQVVLSSRSEPALPVARLRAHGELAEVREEQLRLSSEEAAALFRAAGIALSSEDVGRLTRRTEGWVTALHLTSLIMRDRVDRTAFVAEFSTESRHVLDYLARDVLDATPDDMRDFLVRTSVLEYLSGPLCDAALGSTRSAAMLARIERANLFVVSLDERGDMLRYHHLFATMLRREFERSDPYAAVDVHKRASVWFDQHGEVEAAIEHAIAARDVTRSSALVAAHARSLWSVGRVATVSLWLEALSWREAIADPQLALVRAAVSAQTGHPSEDVERWLDVAAQGTHDGPLASGLQSIESGVALLRAIYLTNGVEVAATEAECAVELEPPESSWRRQALLARGQALYLLGRASEARSPLDEARRLPAVRENAAAAANVLAYLALVELDAGRGAAAEQLARDSLSLLDEQRLGSTFVATNSHVALGRALGVGNELHAAVSHLEQAVELSAPAGAGYWHAHALISLAAALHQTGDVAVGKRALETARAELDALPDTGMLAALRDATERELLAEGRREGLRGDSLTEGELRVLRLLAAGRSVNEVSRKLYLSPNTVKTHRRTIYRKLGTESRAEAVAEAKRLGILGPDEGA